ncbi:heterokaryon incompatibility protein-domain-containing protein [Nemania sp. FL0031]|nr:heterokaryon incompatibility protein-domain-containing protein [Nemania sp. FL0031]
MSSSYEHLPLPSPRSIRVLILEPAISPEARIKCSLERVHLDNIHKSSLYEALSYTWGLEDAVDEIMCHGKPLVVQPNCYRAIKNLRLPSECRRLFIDAICIDQGKGEESVAEREHQIKLMGEVYEKAYRVIIWLGESHPSTGRLFGLLRVIYSIGSLRRATRRIAQSITGGTNIISSGIENLELVASVKLIRRFLILQNLLWRDLAEVSQACAHLVNNTWFTRLWTFQEQFFANPNTSILVYDRHELQLCVWKATTVVLELLLPDERYTPILYSIGQRNVFNITHPSRRQERNLHPTGQHSIVRLMDPDLFLVTTRDLDSKIVQDKIFGIYGIFARAGLPLPEPNYSMTPAHLFETTTRQLIQQSGSLGILRRCTRQISKTDGVLSLPSWVLDWSMKSPPRNLSDSEGDGFLLRHDYDAARGTLVPAIDGQNSGRLALRGIIVGKIEFLAVSSTIGPISAHLDSESEYPFQHFLEACQKWCKHISVSPTYCTGCPTIEAAKRTLLLYGHEKVPDLRQKIPLKSFPEWLDILLYPDCKIYSPKTVEEVRDGVRERVQRHRPNVDPDIDPGVAAMSSAAVMDYSSQIDKLRGKPLVAWANYALMVLDTGHFARGLYLCKEGDVVAVLAGCEFPVALRSDGNGQYQFVAPLYVDGIMYGEEWPDVESELQEIVLV